MAGENQSTAQKMREGSGAGAGTSVAVTQMKNIQTFFNSDQRRAQMAQMLPKHITVDRMVATILTAVSNNPKMLDCELKSLWNAAKSAAVLGLEVGVAGQCYIIPYKKTATFVPGWQGLVDLVSRSGRGTVWTGAVFEGDDFDWALGDSPFVKHRPCGEDNPDLITHVYAIGRVNGAQWPIIEVWPISRIWKHRNQINKVGEAHYSYKHPEMYARKVPLLQVLKYMPKSIELSTAIEVANRAEEGRGVVIDGKTFEVVEENEVQQEQGDASVGKTSKDKDPKKWEPTPEEQAEIAAREKADAEAERIAREGK
jgi:recombination protein RecT